MPHDHRRRSRSRSRNDERERSQHHRSARRRSRSRSPVGARERRRESGSRERVVEQLPFGARRLEKRDYGPLRSLFALYLEVQKQLDLEELDEREAKGRWKSFVNKWNRGDLAEGWYDPSTYTRAEQSLREPPPPASPQHSAASNSRGPHYVSAYIREDHDEDDEDYGPALPSSTGPRARPGATVPTVQDLALRRENQGEEREAELEARRNEWKEYRRQEKARLDELAPKAEAGTRERQLEKKRETAAANRTFAASRAEAGGVPEVRDDVLMGGGDEAEDYRRIKQEQERKKTEKELRRDEIFRAKQAEREQRMKAYKEKEDRTMAGLVALAKQRFG